MENFIYSIPTKVLFGKNMIERLPECILEYGRKVLFVYGGGSIKKSGLYNTITDLLKNNGIMFVELSGVEPNARLSTVERGVGNQWIYRLRKTGFLAGTLHRTSVKCLL